MSACERRGNDEGYLSIIRFYTTLQSIKLKSASVKGPENKWWPSNDDENANTITMSACESVQEQEMMEVISSRLGFTRPFIAHHLRVLELLTPPKNVEK